MGTSLTGLGLVVDRTFTVWSGGIVFVPVIRKILG